MINPESSGGSMGGSVCKICKRQIKDHLPEEFQKCQTIENLKRDGR